MPKKNNLFLTLFITLFLSSIIYPTISYITNDNSEATAYFDIEEESKEGELFNDLEVKFLEFDKQKSFSTTNLIAKKNSYYYSLDLIVVLYKDIFLLPPKLF